MLARTNKDLSQYFQMSPLNARRCKGTKIEFWFKINRLLNFVGTIVSQTEGNLSQYFQINEMLMESKINHLM